jgi:hypothetical protein
MTDMAHLDSSKSDGMSASVDATISDETLRARVRGLLEARPPESRIAAALKHPLLLSLVGFMLTWGVGTLLTDNIKAGQIQRDRALEDDRARRAASIQAVNTLSALIYDRRTRAELVLSAARRGVLLPELFSRKAAYDSAYVAWNRSIQSTLLGVRDIVGEKEYSEVESYVEFALTPHFRVLDRLVTDAFDQRVKSNAPPDSEARTEASRALQASLDCAYTITNALWIIAATSPRDSTRMAQAKQQTTQELEQRCPRQAPQ